jgi:hypothetical protein
VRLFFEVNGQSGRFFPLLPFFFINILRGMFSDLEIASVFAKAPPVKSLPLVMTTNRGQPLPVYYRFSSQHSPRNVLMQQDCFAPARNDD